MWLVRLLLTLVGTWATLRAVPLRFELFFSPTSRICNPVKLSKINLANTHMRSACNSWLF